MLKRNLILLTSLIAPLIATSQDSLTTVKISDLRRAAELIIEGDECKAIMTVKDAQIENKNAVISELKTIRSMQDSIISKRVSQLTLKDSIIVGKSQIIESQRKRVKKHKVISYALGALLVVAVIL